MSNDVSKIKVDLNKITRREFRTYINKLDDNGRMPDEAQAEFVVKVVTAWPYDNPITEDGYLDLPLGDALTVDKAINKAITDTTGKN